MPEEKEIKERLIKAVNSFTDDIDAIAKDFDLDFGKLMYKALEFMLKAFKVFAEYKKEKENEKRLC